MLTRFHSWIVPSFPDEETNRKALALNVMALAALLLSVGVNAALLAATIRNGQWLQVSIAAATLAASFLWIGAIYFLSRRGRVAAASHFLLWGGVAIALGTNLPDATSGMRDPGWYMFALIVVAASLLLSARWGLIFAAVETLLYVVSGLL